MYTALHELSHHIDYTENRDKTSRNAHGGEFRAIFHGLLEKAVENGDYAEMSSPFLDEVIQINKDHTVFLKKFGKALIALLDLCQKTHHNFEDVVERKLSMKPGWARDIMRVYAMDIS